MTLASYNQRRRQRTYRRMLAQLRRGEKPQTIHGDRDVLAAALDAYRRETACDASSASST